MLALGYDEYGGLSTSMSVVILGLLTENGLLVTQGVSSAWRCWKLCPSVYRSTENLTLIQGRLGLPDHPCPRASLSKACQSPPCQLGMGRQTRIHRRESRTRVFRAREDPTETRRTMVSVRDRRGARIHRHPINKGAFFSAPSFICI